MCAAALGGGGCTFQLDAPEELAGSIVDASTDSEAGTSLGDAFPDAPLVPDAAPEASKESGQEASDACSPSPDQELCSLNNLDCGDHSMIDNCGQSRNLVCGSCGADSHCDQGVCVPFSYAWKTGAWSACSKSCDGGQRTRQVWCERDDGQTVADALCVGSKPAGTEACNSQACCTTGTLSGSGQHCSGGTSDVVNWIQFHFGSDTGSVSDREACAAQCTAWGKAAGLTSWCCDLIEDSTTGTSWACAAHTGTSIGPHSNVNSKGSYAGLGSCASP